MPEIVLHINYLSKLMKLHRKIKHNEEVCSKLCLSNNSKTTEAKFAKLHRKTNIMGRCVAHKSKAPRPKVKVTIRSEFKLCLKLCCS